jgi:hypothetical protein
VLAPGNLGRDFGPLVCAMVDMKAILREDDNEVALVWPDHPGSDFTLTFTAEELERFIEILIEIRTHMRPPVSRA